MSTAAATTRPVAPPTPGARSSGRLSGLGPAVRLLVRRLRVRLLAWSLPLLALMAATPPSYERTYPSLAEREVIVAGMRDSPGTRMLYGVLPLPGRIGQLVQWETGFYLLVCVSLMAVLLTCRTMRADEDDGLVELERGAGAGRWTPFAASPLVVWGAVGLLALGAGLILTGETRAVAELTVPGAWVLAGTLAVTGWAFAALAALACQLAGQAGPARGMALAALGVSFVLRVLADDSGASWLRWLSPLAWRDLAAPYSEDRALPLLGCAGLAVAAELVAAVLHAHREHLAGCLPERAPARRRWHVRGPADLLVRLSRRPVAAWAVACVATSALFGAMAGDLVDLLSPGSQTGEYINRMVEGSPVEQFTSLMTVMIVLLVVIAAVQRVNALAADERAGIVELVTATGLSRTRLFLTQAGVAAAEAVLLALASGGALAAVTATQLSEDHAVARAFVFTVSQLPGVAAAAGLALALVGLVPRLSALAWAPVAWSAFARLFGGLVDLPRWAQEMSLLGHELDVVGTPDWVPLAVQSGIGAAGALVGLWAYRRRDLAR